MGIADSGILILAVCIVYAIIVVVAIIVIIAILKIPVIAKNAKVQTELLAEIAKANGVTEERILEITRPLIR